MPYNADGNSNGLELSIGDLPAGVYWVKVNEAGRSEILKFVRL
ncbi:MAG: T9SS type A sorting domain-containing protein [Saprospiraceae bacterium]